MKVVVTIRGELEEYIQAEAEKTGLSNAMVTYILATQGWEYKKALNGLTEITKQIKKTEGERTGE